MKKHIKISLAVIGILLALIVLCVYIHNTYKTQGDMVSLLRKELQLAADDGSIISCVGEFALEEIPTERIYENTLLWFSIQNQGMTYYRAVGCQVTKTGKYHIRNIYKPMIYAKDIVHVVWRAKDVFLIADPNCRSAVFEDPFGNIVLETKFPSDGIPCVFLFEPPIKETKFDFYDLNGNVIP